MSDVEHIRSLFQSGKSVASSDDLENIVAAIRQGNEVSIFTPSDTSYSSLENDPQNSPITPLL